MWLCGGASLLFFCYRVVSVQGLPRSLADTGLCGSCGLWGASPMVYGVREAPCVMLAFVGIDQWGGMVPVPF